jgi:hypothetical protein
VKPPPSAMVVYAGTLALGEIKDYGRRHIKGYVYADGKPILIGTSPDRKAAIGAVGDAAGRRAVSNEQPPPT